MTPSPGDRGENPDLTVKWPGAETEARAQPSNRTAVRRERDDASPSTSDDESDSSAGPADTNSKVGTAPASLAGGRKLLRLWLPADRQTSHGHHEHSAVVSKPSESDLMAEIRSLRTEAAELRDEVDRLRTRVKELGG